MHIFEVNDAAVTKRERERHSLRGRDREIAYQSASKSPVVSSQSRVMLVCSCVKSGSDLPCTYSHGPCSVGE